MTGCVSYDPVVIPGLLQFHITWVRLAYVPDCTTVLTVPVAEWTRFRLDPLQIAPMVFNVGQTGT
jgi:hypothetical protein